MCADITTAEAPERKYDLITAFRFFLDAGPPLRVAVIRALALRLKNARSVLAFTNHGNPFSYKAIAWPYHQMRRRGRDRPIVGNYMTHSDVMELLAQANLKVVEQHGYGFVTPKLFRAAPTMAAKLERSCARRRFLNKFGVNKLYMVARADG